MASVRLDFTPPQEPDVVALRIYESDEKDGVYVQIERVAGIGLYPYYISYYTTALASDANGWFRIAWESVGGLVGPQSPAVQGGATSPLAQIVQRVMLRDATLDENIAVQSAEFVISEVMKTEDPADPALILTIRQKEAITLLTLARASIQSYISASSDSESYTAGLVSQKSSNESTDLEKLIGYLTKEANRLLGIGNSYIFVMPDIDPTGLGTQTSINWDHTRLALTVNYE